MKQELILWIDLETTGLIPREDSVVEVGWILTRKDLSELSEGTAVVKYTEEELPGVIGHMDDYVTRMHTSSGLVEAMSTAEHTLLDIEWSILEQLGEHPDSTFYIGGHSVHFDRGFIEVHMPRVHAALSHRHFDVRVFEFAESFWDDAYLKPKGVSNHRAMDFFLSLRHPFKTLSNS